MKNNTIMPVLNEKIMKYSHKHIIIRYSSRKKNVNSKKKVLNLHFVLNKCLFS